METNRVKEIRKLRKMTQVELAQAVGVAQGSIQKLENGEISLDIKWMKNLALALDVKPYELLPEEWQPEEVSPEEREILRMIRKKPHLKQQIIAIFRRKQSLRRILCHRQTVRANQRQTKDKQ